MTCQQIESLLPPFVDGIAGPDDEREVSMHLSTCVSCRQLVELQRSVRLVLQVRAVQLAPVTPPGLRTRIEALSREAARPHKAMQGWQGRLSTVGASVLVVIIAGAVLVPVLTSRSTVLLAAELALDHLKCFVIDGDAQSAPIPSDEAEAIVRGWYGRSVRVPASIDSEGLKLVAVRRCLHGEGTAVHLLYRLNDEPISLFVISGHSHAPVELDVLRHREIVWQKGENTYMLVAADAQRDQMQRVATEFRNEAQ